MTIKLNACNGDYSQRGCATGKPSVHRVHTHGNTRDVCAFHSPYDVTDEHPIGYDFTASMCIRKVKPGIKGIRAFLAADSSGWHTFIDGSYTGEYFYGSVSEYMAANPELILVGWVGNGLSFERP